MSSHSSQETNKAPSYIEQEALERKIRLGMANDHIYNLISSCGMSGTNSLDLSKKNLSSIPSELLSLSHLEVCDKQLFEVCRLDIDLAGF